MTVYEMILLLSGALIIMIMAPEYHKSKKRDKKLSTDFTTHLISVSISLTIILLYLFAKYILDLLPH